MTGARYCYLLDQQWLYCPIRTECLRRACSEMKTCKVVRKPKPLTEKKKKKPAKQEDFRLVKSIVSDIREMRRQKNEKHNNEN